MRNGDHYLGSVVSLSSNTLVLQSEVLGTLRLPRAAVAAIQFSQPAATNGPAAASAAAAALSAPKLEVSVPAASLPTGPSSAGSESKLLDQLRSQMAGAEGAEARKLFTDMAGGLMTGRLGINDIRAQAQATLDEVRKAQKELGPEAGDALDGYLSILENFLGRAASGEGTASTNPPPAKPRRPTD